MSTEKQAMQNWLRSAYPELERAQLALDLQQRIFKLTAILGVAIRELEDQGVDAKAVIKSGVELADRIDSESRAKAETVAEAKLRALLAEQGICE